jgi:hypothetical protein
MGTWWLVDGLRTGEIKFPALSQTPRRRDDDPDAFWKNVIAWAIMDGVLIFAALRYALTGRI